MIIKLLRAETKQNMSKTLQLRTKGKEPRFKRIQENNNGKTTVNKF